MTTYPLPPSELGSREPIRILHPGYPIPSTLLSLARVDRAAGTTTFGVHYGTALLACQIIASNAFDTGRLTLDQAGQQPVNLRSDDVLTESVYYFMVGDGPSPYPIIPSFRDWQFPHGHIPDSWPQVSTPCLTRRCGITNYSFAVDRAHLVPQEETLWYQRNDMKRYGSQNFYNINNSANIISLQSHLHRCFDSRWFVILPKVTETMTPYSPQYVTHILQTDAVELWPTYQNIVVQHLDQKARPYLFARFAWTILFQAKQFVTDGRSRHVIRIQASDEDKIEYKDELLSGQQLQHEYGGEGSKGATPRSKKPRTDSMVDDEDSDVNMDNDWDDDWDDTMNQWQHQGKERRKQTSSKTAVEEDNQAQLLTELKTQLEEVLPGGGDDIPQQG